MPRGYNQNPYQQNPYQRQGMNQQNMYQRRGVNQQGMNQRQNQYAQNPYMQNQYLQGQISRQMMQNQQQIPQQMSQTPQQMSQPMPQMQQMPQQSPQDPMVSYEPLDEKMLNEIRAGLVKTEPVQDAPPSQESPASQTTTVYAMDKKYIDMIGGFVQNERNASVYYKKLSEKAHNSRQSGILSKIGEASTKQIGTYQEIYKYLSGKDFEATENEVISNVDFYEGVRLAILEESTLLDELNDIYEILPDDKSVKSINKLINRKISLINNLRNLQNRIGL